MKPGRALVCAPMLPEFDKESGSQRILDLLEFLGEEGWQVTFLARDADSDNRYVRLLQQRGIPTFVARDTDVLGLIRHGEFDVALIFFWYIAEWLMPMLRSISSATRIIVDSVDLHYIRVARKILGEKREELVAVPLGGSYADEMAREVSTYSAADAVLTVSQKEANTINDITGETSLALPVTDCESLAPSPLGFGEREGIVFMANFRHPPNLQAAEYFCEDILPKVDSSLFEDGSIRIVGNALPNSLVRFAEADSRLTLVGWVPSVLPYLSCARVSVAPLLYGAGTKRKMVQSLMLGTPCVSTSVGAEGLGLQHDTNVLIADDSSSFADQIQRLATDEALWKRLRRNGLRHIKRLHGRNESRKALVDVLELVFNRPQKRSALPESRPIAKQEYRDVKGHLHNATMAHVPPQSVVAIISRGDDDLIDLPGRVGWHFPRTSDGRYAGFHPKHSGHAIEHLEELRADGATHLVIPRTSFWWLDYYIGFHDHLDANYMPVFRDDSCIIYRILQSPDGEGDLSQDGDDEDVDAQSRAVEIA